MKKSKFTDEQMVAIVQESEGGGVKETARKHQITEQCRRTPKVIRGWTLLLGSK